MAAKEHQGLMIAVIIFAMLAVSGFGATFYFFKQLEEEQTKSAKAQADTRLLTDLVADVGIQSLMVAPITRGPQILGLLMVADRAGRTPFNDEDLNLLLALAGQATVAVENLRLHEEIKKANTLLQEYDRLKSEFVGIVAHDFRRPLMAIRGFAELVLEEPEANPFLPDFYKDPRRYAFQTQMFFLVSRYKDLRERVQPDLFHEGIVADYLFQKDRIFANLNLNDRELTLYNAVAPQLEAVYREVIEGRGSRRRRAR
jgi:signal transduction histidine kinase